MTEKKKWADMDSDEREAAVRRLMADGGSNKSVADDLGTTPGTIAGFRYKKGIPSTHDAPSMGKPKPEKSRASIAPRVSAPEEKPRLKMAATEATQCKAKDKEGHRCGYEFLPGSEYCGLPQHQKLKTKARRS